MGCTGCELRAMSPTSAAVYVHEAAYRVGADALGVRLRPTRLDRGVVRYAGDLFAEHPNDGTPEGDEVMALIMLVADAALDQFAPTTRGRDNVEARDLLFRSFQRRCGMDCLKIPSVYREFNVTIAALEADARAFVREHQDEIIRVADDLKRRGLPAKSNGFRRANCGGVPLSKAV